MISRRRRTARQGESLASPIHITRLDRTPTQPPVPPPVPAPENVFAARFTQLADVLTFLAAVRDDGARRYPPTKRAPDQAVWVIVRGYRTPDVELTWALGGVVHLPDGQDLVSPRGRRQRWADLESWPQVSWVELATGIRPGTAAPEQSEILVVTTGSLARWIIDRFQHADLDIRVATAHLKAIFREPEDWAAVLIRVTARGRAVPRSFAHALSGLPHTVVCRVGGGRLLVDQRLSLPLPDADLARWVPEGQEWLLAGGLGCWQLTEQGAEFAPPLRADPALRPPPVPRPGRLPTDLRIDVRLVRDDRRGTVDALLLTDEDLGRLRRLLPGQPAAERAFLVLGPGQHLYAEPGRAVSEDIPYGVEMHRIGPGALYQEVGYRLKPALPGPARAALFAVDERSLVVLRDGETHRLALENTIPVWSLWLGTTTPADPAAGRLSAEARAVLTQVDAAGVRLERPDLATGTPTREQASLYTEGFQLEQLGKLAEAARTYWKAGRPALAARLYELAAEADR